MPHVRAGRTASLASLLTFVLLAPAPAAARDLISADGPGGTYDLLGRSYGIEVPDCKHKVDHITEVMDDQLGKPVFVFHAHKNEDDDRCMNADRQRTELRGKGEGVQGALGRMVYYRWKMKLPAGFQASGAFTHLFQIKAYGNGHGSGAPIMTLTPRNGTFGIDGRIGVRGQTQLSNLIDTWVVIELSVLHADAGKVGLDIKRVKDGSSIVSYSGTADMFDDGAAYGAPKFGIYRSLNDAGALRDEQVRFADFCVSFTSFAECADGAAPAPSDAGAPDVGDAGEPPGTGGNGGLGGASGTGGSGTGGVAGSGGGTGGASSGSGGSSSTGGRPGSGGSGSGGAPNNGGGSGSADPGPGATQGCSCDVGGRGGNGSAVALGFLLAGLSLARRRRR